MFNRTVKATAAIFAAAIATYCVEVWAYGYREQPQAIEVHARNDERHASRLGRAAVKFDSAPLTYASGLIADNRSTEPVTIVAAVEDRSASPEGRPTMQLGLGGPWSPWILESALLNVSRNWSGWTAIGEGRPEMDMAALWNAGYINKKTLMPTGIPKGYDYIRGGLFRFGARFYPDYYAGKWVVEWSGDADVRLGFGYMNLKNRLTREGSRRIVFDFAPNDENWMNIEITRIGDGGLQSLSIHRIENDSAAKAGEIFDPEFLGHACRYDVLRAMDVTYSMKSSTRSAQMMTPYEAGIWGRSVELDRDAPDMPLGPPMRALFELAAKCNNSLWYNIAGPIGADSDLDAFSFGPDDEGKPDGDAIQAAAKSKTQAIIASKAWDGLADEMVDSLKASGYPAGERLIIEVGNEVWNYAHPFWWMTRYYTGIGQSVGSCCGLLAYSYGQGYAAARYAHAFDAALNRAGRQQAWTMALGAQTANPLTSKSVLAGYRKYFEDRKINPAPWMAKAGLSTTSYYYGALEADGLIAKKAGESDAAWAARWLAAVRADPDGLAIKLTNWHLSATPRQGNLEWNAQMRATQRQIAEEAGAYFLGDYEGGSHETGGVKRHLEREPDFVNWLEQWRWGPQGEKVTRAWIERMHAADPDAIIANFASICAVDPQGEADTDKELESPWCDNFYGEQNGFTRGIEPFLRP